ncbi:MAG: hypothetical protein ABIJ97_01495 [Bacteroidota bacterium]
MKKTFLLLTVVAATIGCTETKTNRNYPTEVIVDAKSSYVMQGDTFEAQVIPINSSQWNDLVSFENTGVEIIDSKWENGVLKVSIIADQEGLAKFSGNLKVKTEKGDTVLPFMSEFITTKPMVSIKTNCLIKDIENSIEIGMQGVPPFFELSATEAEIKGDFGNYTIIPHKAGTLKIFIKSKDGKTDYGSFEFEVFEKK